MVTSPEQMENEMYFEPGDDMIPEQWVVDENVRVEGNLIPIDDRTWAIHGEIPVDGDVLGRTRTPAPDDLPWAYPAQPCW